MNASLSSLLFRTELCWRISTLPPPSLKVITKVGGQDEKGHFKVRRREGKREGQTDSNNPEVHLSAVTVFA